MSTLIPRIPLSPLSRTSRISSLGTCAIAFTDTRADPTNKTCQRRFA